MYFNPYFEFVILLWKCLTELLFVKKFNYYDVHYLSSLCFMIVVLKLVFQLFSFTDFSISEVPFRLEDRSLMEEYQFRTF